MTQISLFPQIITKVNETNKKWREKNKEYIKQKGIEYYQKNKKKILIKLKNDRKLRPEFYKQKDRIKYRNNKESSRLRNKKYHQLHRNELLIYNKKYYIKNKDSFLAYNRKRYQLTKDNYKIKIRRNIGSLIRIKLKLRLKNKKSKSINNILPWTIDELIKHLEKLFKPGMSWKNYGFYGWHIDHIIPDSSFHYTSVEDEEFQKCWALENLQPMWAEENLKKGNKII